MQTCNKNTGAPARRSWRQCHGAATTGLDFGVRNSGHYFCSPRLEPHRERAGGDKNLHTDQKLKTATVKKNPTYIRKHRTNNRPAATNLENTQTQTPATRPSPALPYVRLRACASSSHNATDRAQDNRSPRGRTSSNDGHTHAGGRPQKQTPDTTRHAGGAGVLCNARPRDCFHPT